MLQAPGVAHVTATVTFVTVTFNRISVTVLFMRVTGVIACRVKFAIITVPDALFVVTVTNITQILLL